MTDRKSASFSSTSNKNVVSPPKNVYDDGQYQPPCACLSCGTDLLVLLAASGDYKMPMTQKRTNPLLVRPVVGQVKATTYNLPGDDYVYGKVDNGDEEGAREGTNPTFERVLCSQSLTLPLLSARTCSGEQLAPAHARARRPSGPQFRASEPARGSEWDGDQQKHQYELCPLFPCLCVQHLT
jgi:hypothetical protein